ncbi:unnamed protein product [Nezara viridula]|uniref:Uncharacterized protein n=1 Tax=Nezara viridula TaxID=85310 RepID=A0A9P0MXF0_NEZVI|nr:unnamed protein product [Nezara viridula]
MEGIVGHKLIALWKVCDKSGAEGLSMGDLYCPSITSIRSSFPLHRLRLPKRVTVTEVKELCRYMDQGTVSLYGSRNCCIIIWIKELYRYMDQEKVC